MVRADGERRDGLPYRGRLPVSRDWNEGLAQGPARPSEAHTNGLGSLWATLKRGHHGVYHRMSVQHLHRYIQEYAGRHNLRDKDTLDQMRDLVAGMVGKRLMYKDLVK